MLRKNSYTIFGEHIVTSQTYLKNDYRYCTIVSLDIRICVIKTLMHGLYGGVRLDALVEMVAI